MPSTNFSGSWILDRSRSEFGFLPPPRRRADDIVQTGNSIRIATLQWDSSGKASVVRELEIDGPSIQIEIRNVKRLLRAYWDSDEMIVETSSIVSNNQRLIEDRWSLPDDQLSIRIARLHHLPGGDVHQRLLLTKT